MKFSMPSFSSIVAAQPVMPVGATIGNALGQSFGTISAGIAANKHQKATLTGMADAMEQYSPESAAMFRGIADTMPLIDPAIFQNGPGGGSGSSRGGGYGGGLGSLTGMAMDNMLDLVKMERANSLAIKLENIQLGNSLRLERERGLVAKDVKAFSEGEERKSEEHLTGQLKERGEDETAQKAIQEGIKAAFGEPDRRAAAERARMQLEQARVFAEANKAASENNRAAVERQSEAAEKSAQLKKEAAEIRAKAADVLGEDDIIGFASRKKDPLIQTYLSVIAEYNGTKKLKRDESTLPRIIQAERDYLALQAKIRGEMEKEASNLEGEAAGIEQASNAKTAELLERARNPGGAVPFMPQNPQRAAFPWTPAPSN